MRFVSLVGRSFGRLVVTERADTVAGHIRYKCRCECGAEKVIHGSALKAGLTKSCGCMATESKKDRKTQLRHGKTGSPEWHTWEGMKKRCLNPKAHGYKNYGGRGINVCERWLTFDNFYADMGERPAGMTLDRWPDTNGNYEPGNCRWATKLEQCNNTRYNKLLTVSGETKTIANLARATGLSPARINNRMRNGFDETEILSMKDFRKDSMKIDKRVLV